MTFSFKKCGVDYSQQTWLWIRSTVKGTAGNLQKLNIESTYEVPDDLWW